MAGITCFASVRNIRAKLVPRRASLANRSGLELVSEPGKRFYGPIRLWQEDQIETNISAYWDQDEEEALACHF